MVRKSKSKKSNSLVNSERILVEQGELVECIAGNQNNFFLNRNEVRGVRLIRYNICQYSSPRPYYEGNITFDNGTEKEARFFKFKEKEVAQKCFDGAWKMNDDGILKPWFLSHCKDDDAWIICYERFDNLLSECIDYLVLPDNDTWKDSVRSSMETVNYIHKRKLLHEGLSKTCNYALIDDPKTRTIKIKIIFDSSWSVDNSVTGNDGYLNNFDFYGVKRLKDWTDFRGVLKDVVLKSLGELDETNSFLAFFDSTDGGFWTYDIFVRQLLSHPYLMKSAKRMKYILMFEHTLLVAKRLRRFDDFEIAVNGDEFKMYRGWIENLTPWLSDHCWYDMMEKEISYDSDNVFDLLRFLRNLGVHDKSRDYARSYDEVHTSFPNLCNQLHRYL